MSFGNKPSARGRRSKPGPDVVRYELPDDAVDVVRTAGHRQPKQYLDFRMHAAYYDVLKSDAAFRKAFSELVTSLAGLTALPPGPTGHYVRRLEPATEPPAAAAGVLQEFIRAWPLPRVRALHDLWTSVCDASPGEEVVRPGPIAVVIETMIITITPKPVATSAFDPGTMSPREARAAIKRAFADAERATLQRFRAVEKELHRAGWQPVPSWHANPEEAMRLARRLYWAAHEGLSTEQILGREARAKAEAVNPIYEPPSAQAVNKLIRHWAQRLGIRLRRAKD
jgi:hypothetical protein